MAFLRRSFPVLCTAGALAYAGPGANATSRARLPEPAAESFALARGGFRVAPVGVRGGYYGGWRRPYAWAPGGAIAAGAAIGVLSADAAVGYASVAAPADGLCWYYSDDSATQGFWDVCQ